jgi:uncharacterized secreted protein with C-terminal beta-propeller domain
MKKRFLSIFCVIALVCSIVMPAGALTLDPNWQPQQKFATLNDALEILKHISGIEIIQSPRYAHLDFDRDGFLTINDVLLVLKGLSGQIDMPTYNIIVTEEETTSPITTTVTPLVIEPHICDEACDDLCCLAQWLDGDNDYSALFKQLAEFHNPQPMPPSISTSMSLSSGRVGVQYSVFINTNGGDTPISWAHLSGELPAGLTFNPATRQISGIPTESGTYSFTIRASNHVGENSRVFTITIQPAIVTTTAVTATVTGIGTAQTGAVTTTFGTAPAAATTAAMGNNNNMNQGGAQPPVDPGNSWEMGADNDRNTNQSNNNDFSDTNNQVEGVQESDIVKTDGRFIYVASTGNRNNLRVSVVRADNGQMETIKTISLQGKADQLHEMLLWKEKLVIIYSNSVNEFDSERGINVTKRTVTVDMYLTNGNFNRPTSTYSQDGTFHSARMIDNNIYLITNHRPNLPRTITTNDVDLFVPAFELNGTRHLVPPSMIIKPDVLDRVEYTIIAGLDVHRRNMAVSVVSNLGSARVLYASMDNIYVSRTKTVTPQNNILNTNHVNMNSWWTPANNNEQFTVIDRFSIDKGKVKHRANTEVRGQVRNQFHFDEFEGHLRIVTEVWGMPAKKSDFSGEGTWQILPIPENRDDHGWWQERMRSTTNEQRETNWGLQGGSLYTLDMNLNVLSEVHRIGFGENVHSVRMAGDIGYIVTFWQTDPLFSFDLSDPKNPILLGELKIPGFSRYMEQWSDGLLLGMGVDTNERGVRQGLKLTMFDVSDNEDLIEKHIIQFGRNGRSAFENDHRAALVSPRRNIIGFPYMAGGASFYAVYSYCDKEGFMLIGELRANSTQVTTTYFCCHWCGYVTRGHTNPAPEFRRGLFIGNYIYAISDNLIVSARFTDGFEEIMRLEL